MLTVCSCNKIRQGNDAVYDSLIAGHLKYGASKTNICKHNLGCKSSQICEKVIIAPTYSVEYFAKESSNIKEIAKGSCKYEIHEVDIDGEKFSIISTGVGEANVLGGVLTLGCTSCKEVICRLC